MLHANFVLEIDRCAIVQQQLNASQMTSNASVMQTRSTLIVHSQRIWRRLR